MSGVLDDGQPVLLGQGFDLLQLGRLTGVVDHHDRLELSPTASGVPDPVSLFEFPAHSLFQGLGRGHIVVLVDIDEDREGSHLKDGVHRRDEGKRSDHDLVPRTDPQCQKGHMEGRRRRMERHRASTTQVFAKLPFKLPRLRPRCIPVPPEHPLDRLPLLPAQAGFGERKVAIGKIKAHRYSPFLRF